ncbi:MAG TPA: lantibiotic dehydratase [Longimicrobiaceae bacterium]|nr:lantibiotic dehydratase [Longimicrobiaceae bacterium]
MSTVPEKRTIPVQNTGTRRLLAVRRAGAAFDGPFRLRAPRFEALLEEHARLRRTLDEARGPLLDALHDAVPAQPDRAARRAVLQAKRDVFNGRTPSPLPPGAAPELRAALDRYARLLEREAGLFSAARGEVVAEIRQRVGELLRDERFRLAVGYASPDLREELERGSSAHRDDLVALERGVYSYAARFLSKANPFHVFAYVLFPPTAGMEVDGAHEVVVDTSSILELEQWLLPHVRDPRRVRLHLRTYDCTEKGYSFWLPGPDGFRIAALPATPLLQRIVVLFQERHRSTGRPTGTWAECETSLCADLPADARPRAGEALSILVNQGILAEYLVPDLGRFAPSLLGVSPACDEQIDRLQRYHLSRIDAPDLARAHAELESCRIGTGGEPVRFFVNSYARADTEPHEAAARELFDDLFDLKPCFGAEHNFSAHGHVLRSFLLDSLRERRGGTAPYLELLRHFLRHRNEVVATYHPDVHLSPAVRERRAAWRSALARETGTLSRERLRELSAGSPFGGAPESLCFNGPFDYVERVFHVSNVFAGEGRFVSRYLLHREVDSLAGPETAEEVIDVELVAPPSRNLNYVVRAHRVGCGFEARYAERYDRWIDPSEVQVEASGSRVVYRHARSGLPLRFHYRGFLLAQFLPPEYQLLLADHADTFFNPFRGADPRAVPLEGIRREPGLRYGAVCLRRDRWIVRPDLLLALVSGDDLLRSSALLREWIHAELEPDTDEWFYQGPGMSGKGYKPRFLDLRNPLSVQGFRRALATSAGGVVSLAAMDPPEAHLFREDGAPYVTELMIEV